MATPAGYTQGVSGFFFKTVDGSGPYSVDSAGNVYLVGSAVGPSGSGSVAWNYAAAAGGIINTVAVQLKAAAGVGLSNYLETLQVVNASAVASEFEVRNTAGAVLFRGYAPTTVSPPVSYQFDPPLKGAANTALEVAMLTTATQTYVNAQGFVNS